MDKLLRLYGRNLLTHLGALIGALVPYVVQLATRRLGWVDATIASSAIIATWLLANAHVSSKLAGSIATELSGLLGGKAPGGAATSELMTGLESLMGGIFGGGQMGGAGATHTTAQTTAVAATPPPPGLAGVTPPGYMPEPPTAHPGPSA